MKKNKKVDFDSLLDDGPEQETARNQDDWTSKLFNPLERLTHDQMNPDQPPVSLINKKPMIMLKAGSFDGPKVRVWAAPSERLVFPKLKSRN